MLWYGLVVRGCGVTITDFHERMEIMTSRGSSKNCVFTGKVDF